MKTQTKSCLNNFRIFLAASLCHRSRRTIGALAVLLAGLLLGGAGQAAQIVWTNTSGGYWNDAANWSPNQVPSSADDAVIAANGTYAVTLNTSPTINSLALGGASGQQALTTTVLVEPGNAPPTAKLTVPAQSLAGHTFVVKGSGTDIDGTVTNLTLLVGTNVLASVPGSSAQVNFSSDFPGTLTFTAVATDNGGAQGATNATVAITTQPLRTLDAVGFQTNLAFKLCMLGEAGTNYQVLSSTNLAVPGWTILGTMESTNGIWRFLDTAATNSSRFYQAQQLP